MADNLLLTVTLLLILVAVVVLIARILTNMRTSSNWIKDWQQLAQDNNLTYREMLGQSNVTGMYQGRLVNLLGSVKAGTSILITTNNWENNYLEIKSKGIPARSSRDPEAQFRDGLRIESRSSEFTNHLFSNMHLRHRLAPLAIIPNLTITLSGAELALRTPSVIHEPEDVVAYLDVLSDLAGQIEAIRE